MLKVNAIVIILAIIAAVFLIGQSAFAQDSKDDLRDKIEKIKLEKMIKKMDLDKSTAESFKEKYKSFSSTIRELNKKRAKAYTEMTQNIESGSGLDSLLDEVIRIEGEINQEKLNFVSDLKSILTSKQIATMIVFERKFNNQLQKLLKEYQKKQTQNN
jgi:hypothetical protein